MHPSFKTAQSISDFTHKIQDSYRNIIETSSFGATTWHQAFDDTASCTDPLTCQGQRCKQRKGPHHGKGWLGLFLNVIFWVGLRGRFDTPGRTETHPRVFTLWIMVLGHGVHSSLRSQGRLDFAPCRHADTTADSST